MPTLKAPDAARTVGPGTGPRPADDVGVVGPSAAGAALAVVHVIAPGAAGGAERVVQALATGQRRRGHRVSVLAVLGSPRQDRPLLRSLTEEGVEVVPLHLAPRAYHRERAAVAAMCRQMRADVLHTHGYRADVVDAGVARQLHVPTVTTVHGFTGGDLRNRLYERLQRWALRRFDAVVAVSRPLAAELARAGVPAERLHLVRNAWLAAAPPLARSRARDLLGVPAECFHVGWVGRLAPEKGPDVLLAAVAQLGDLPLAVSILGDGRWRPHLEALAERCGLGSRVHWCGTVPDAERLFAGFDVLVLSSRAEGTPMVLFEAMAVGTPIVATAVGGVPDVVSGAEALLVPSDDPAALAVGVRSIHADAAAAAARAARAHARLASEFAAAPWLASYERIYRSLR